MILFNCMNKSNYTAQKNSVNIVLSNTYLSGFYKIIDEISQKMKSNPDENIILVVPDKFSLNAEQIFMERTELSSVFNVWLTTLSRLIANVVDNEMHNFKLLSKNSGTLLVSQIILNNKDKISTYKKVANDYDLAERMYNIINLLKSSGIMPIDLLDNINSTNFGMKIKDIYLIYNEYEKAMKKNIDAITRLDIFNEKVKLNQYVNNSHLYFAMFDSFTNVQYKSLANLAKNCRSFTISLCANTIQDNAIIFDNNIFSKMKNYFEESHIACKITNTLQQGSDIQKYLSKNLFTSSYKLPTFKKFNTDKIKLMECSDINEEARYVASKIKYMIMEKGFVFDDFNIAINGLNDYQLSIQKIFDEFDLPYYTDASRTLVDHYFIKTIFKVANFVSGQKTLSNAISLVMSPIFDVDEEKKYDFQNYCNKYNIIGNEFYSTFEKESTELCSNAEEVRKNIFDNIQKFENELFNCKSFVDYKLCLIEYLEKIDARKVIETHSQKQNDVIKKQLDSLVYDKFLACLDEVDDFVADVEVSQKGFFEMLFSCLNGTNLLTTPMMCDTIFVGDASQSTYYPRKVLFVLGASQSRMPLYQSDCGMLTDGEIALFQASNKISPTIKELNKRERFKLFNLLITADEHLELCYSTQINGQVEFKSEFIVALQNIITTNHEPLTIEIYNNEELKIINDTTSQNFIYMIGTAQNAIKIASGKQSNLKNILIGNYSHLLDFEKEKYLEDDGRYKLSDSRNKIFQNNKTSTSQIERYFKCPFMQFIDYGIKPKENPVFEIRNIDVGNILHKVAEKYVLMCIKNQYQFDFDNHEKVKKIFDEILQTDKFKSFNKNVYAIENLKDEAIRFCDAIKNQIESSDFKPKYVEKKFDDFRLNHDLAISGVVDRIDIFDVDKMESNEINTHSKYMRIIDYKTGKDSFSFKDIYYGIKLQLLVYMSVMKNILDTQPATFGYMPIKNKFYDFYDEEFASYKIDGITLKNDGLILRLDKNLIDNKSSNIINVDFKKDGTYSAKSLKYLLENQEIINLETYTFSVVNKALEEMLDGYIIPKPYKDGQYSSCDRCKYKSLCHYKKEELGYREIKPKQKTDF